MINKEKQLMHSDLSKWNLSLSLTSSPLNDQLSTNINVGVW